MDTLILRERLRRAIESRDATQATVSRMRAIVANAVALVRESNAELRQLKRREVEAADRRAATLADSLRRGDEPQAIPTSVAEGAIAETLAKHATAKAAAQRQAEHLRASLDGLAATWLGAPDVPPRPVSLPPSVLHAMTETRPEPSASHQGQWSDSWKRFHAALMRDADAALANPDRPALRVPMAAFRMPTPDPHAREHLVAAASRIAGAKYSIQMHCLAD